MDVLTAIEANIQTFWEPAVAWIVSAIPNLVAALLIVIVGLAIARWAGSAMGRLIVRTERVDNTMRDVVRTIVAYAVTVIALVAALGQLGFQTTSLLAALGAVGLAVGLALQRTLSNIAAGFMLLWLHPFRLGDYIKADAGAGTVREVGLFATELESWDGIYQFVPNAELWNTRIVNYSRLKRRLVEIKIGVGYTDEIDQAKSVLLRVAGNDDRVLASPHEPTAFVDELGDSAVILSLRVWAAAENYWALRRALTENAKAELDAAGISIPYPQLQLHAPALAETRRRQQASGGNQRAA